MPKKPAAEKPAKKVAVKKQAAKKQAAEQPAKRAAAKKQAATKQAARKQPAAKASAKNGGESTFDASRFAPQFESALADVARAFGGDASGVLATSSAVLAVRARRLAGSEERLAEHLGKDHPRVVAIRSRREHVAGVRRGFELEQKRRASEEPLRPGEWLATGRVVDADGNPLAGFQVVVFDEDKGADDPLGDELTDDAGEFRAEYHERDFRDEDGDDVPALSVLVFDRSGKLVFESDGAVRANSSRRDRFEIMLGNERLDKGVERRPCAGTTASGEPCKNPARPGTKFCGVHAPG